jgi:hypothetical protein
MSSREEENPFASPQSASMKRRGMKAAFVSGHTSAVVAIVAFGVTILARLMLAVADYSIIRLLSRPIVIPFLVAAELQANVESYALVGTFHMVTFAFTGLAFINWFHRVHRNLRPLENGNLRWSSGWTLGAWFIPLACWYIPYRIMAEIWCGSDPARRSQPARGSGLILLRSWWGLWVLVSLAGISRYAANMIPQPTASGILAFSWWSFVANLLAIPAAVLAILVIRRVDRNQAERHFLIIEQHGKEATDSPAYLATMVATDSALEDDTSFSPPAETPSGSSNSQEETNMPWLDG